MRRFTELLLLTTCIFLLPLFVYGLGSFHSTVKYNAEQRGTVIRGLLVIRQDNYYCPYAGEYICESIHCCPGGWNCCRGLSLPPTVLFEFHRSATNLVRRQLLSSNVSTSGFKFQWSENIHDTLL